MFDSMSSMFAFTEPSDGRILFVNDTWVRASGIPRDQAIGRTGSELNLWPDAAERRRLQDELHAHGRVLDCETRVVMRGVSLSVLVSITPVEMESGRHLLWEIRDITGQKRAREEEEQLKAELMHAQKLESVGRLAGGVAHDMNNVLTAIMALGSVLPSKYPRDADLASISEVILQACQRGRDLVKALTGFVRKDLQDAAPIDLNELVRNEAALLEHTTLKKVEIRTALHEVPCVIHGDTSAISNVLMNLCVNAIDAMPEGGRITLSTALRPDGWAELGVEDTGEGMSAEIMANAMEPFFTTKPLGKGTGLGLSIVYGTVKSHGGNVQITSQPGQGTRVTLSFPPSLTISSAAPEPLDGSAQVLPGCQLLVVDDDSLVLTSIVTLLELSGHRVHQAGSGIEALRLLDGGLAVDAVILDMNMPELSGLETLLRLRQTRPNLPVLVSSGFVDDQTRTRLQDLGPLSILPKPYFTQEVQQALMGLL